MNAWMLRVNGEVNTELSFCYKKLSCRSLPYLSTQLQRLSNQITHRRGWQVEGKETGQTGRLYMAERSHFKESILCILMFPCGCQHSFLHFQNVLELSCKPSLEFKIICNIIFRKKTYRSSFDNLK